MMKSKLSLKNSTKSVLLFSFLASLYLCGCSTQIEPTYKENDIPALVKKICKEEYKLDVTTVRTSTTLWIYAPLTKVLHKEFGTNAEKIFDEDMMEKLRNIMTAAGRVLISADVTPEFFGLVTSDINVGLDYTIIGNVLDIKKSYAGFLPWTEANKRYVVKFNVEPNAIGDSTGEHLQAEEIKLSDFLANQMAQRIAAFFQDENYKKYFKIEKTEGKYENKKFTFEYSVTQEANPPAPLDYKKEILNIIAYCLQTYEFKYFEEVEINDLIDQSKVILSRASIYAIEVK